MVYVSNDRLIAAVHQLVSPAPREPTLPSMNATDHLRGRVSVMAEGEAWIMQPTAYVACPQSGRRRKLASSIERAITTRILAFERVNSISLKNNIG